MHGSAWHSRYFFSLASAIALSGAAKVYTPDFRGHGKNPRVRGDVSYIGQLEDDLTDFISYLKMNENITGKIILGGHSSGGGFCVKYAEKEHSPAIDGYLLLTPYLTYDAPTTRTDTGWADANVVKTVSLTLSNKLGIHRFDHTSTLTFNLPVQYRDGTETLSYSHAMVQSMTPEHYREAFASIEAPLLLVVGDQDEVLFANKFPLLLGSAANRKVEFIEKENHMGLVMGDASRKPIIFWLQSLGENPQSGEASSTYDKLAKIEASSGGRIGLSAINTGNNQRFLYRSDERFPMCSTFKAIAVAAVLKRSMSQKNYLKKIVSYTKEDLFASRYAPITEKFLAQGMSIAELSAAAIQYSDNTAANLLIKELGGPEAITAFARSIGDATFRLDRWEPALNTAIPSDIRDTTTPAAMEKSLRSLLFGDVLAPLQRDQFQVWLKGNTTGNTRIRAGVPAGWVVGDKTGTGGYGTTNDIGIIWPPQGDPIVVAIYFTTKNKGLFRSFCG